MTIEFMQNAIKTRNLHAIELLAEKFPHVVADVVQMEATASNIILESTNLIFQIKDFLEPKIEQKFMQVLIPRLIKHSETLFHSIDRSRYPVQIPYLPGRKWNIEKTIMKYLVSGDRKFSYSHVVCEERKERQRTAILLIDKSHSVVQHLQWIIITSILFSLALREKKIGIINFDVKPIVIKSLKDKSMTTAQIVEKLVSIRSGGKTDIFSALVKAKNEFSKEITRKKTLVMISDLLATSGGDFLSIIRQFDDVRIILTPRRQTLQLTKPLLGHLRRMKNVHLFILPHNERSILQMLERVIYL